MKFYNLLFTESPLLLPAFGFSWPLSFQGTFSQVYGQSPQSVVFQPHFTMDIQQPAALNPSASSTPLHSLQKEIHISFLPLFVHLTLAGVWATAGTSLLSPAMQHFWKDQQCLLPVFPHTNTCTTTGQALLTLASYTLPSKAWNLFHQPSMFCGSMRYL